MIEKTPKEKAIRTVIPVYLIALGLYRPSSFMDLPLLEFQLTFARQRARPRSNRYPLRPT